MSGNATLRRPVFSLIVAGLLGMFADQRSPAQTVQPFDAAHPEKMARGLELFQKQIQSILTSHCLRCHGGKSTESGLDLSDRDRLLKGGDNGAAIIPGNARDSLMYKLAAHQKEPHMPHNGKQLSQEALASLKDWIDLGAPYGRSLREVKPAGPAWITKTVASEAREFWSFQPLALAHPPAVKHGEWSQSPIDAFILARQEAAGLIPNPTASRRQLIRRVTLDLIGLPPTPAETEAFVNDARPDAYARLVDRLLASPHYGERWGRFWLDLARFAESHGFEHDYDRPTAYPYRDFVIRAFNDDLPYTTFVHWQLAGDEYEPTVPLAQMATGFLAAGVHSTQITQREVEKHRYDEMDDMLATTSTALLGLTVGCARCHDHKFDPIPQRDYYQLLATFTKTVRSEVQLPIGMNGADVKTLISTEGLPALRLHTQGGDFLPNTHFLRRGDPDQKETVASQAFLQVLMGAMPQAWQSAPPKGSRTTYQRRALAEWLTDVDNGAGALLARVIVNRLWQHHLGRGLVATPSDFGTRGEKPTHPELLDWLAGELIRDGWRLKALHRTILLGSLYQMDSHIDEQKMKIDRDNRLVWHQPLRRLEAEALRDSMLALGDALDTQMYGPGTLKETNNRRSIYFTVKRSQLIPMMQAFDWPDALQGMGERPTTTIAPQALLLMNDPQVRRWAAGLASRAANAGGNDQAAVVRAVYCLVLGRDPEREELNDALAFLSRQELTFQHAGNHPKENRETLVDFCQALLSLNEFAYVE
jgi:mono/diheme cytochrome c family protein